MTFQIELALEVLPRAL